MKKIKMLAIFGLLMATLSGCSLIGGENEVEKLEYLGSEGTIKTQESTLGIPLNTKDITSKLTDNTFYVLHENVLYPLYSDYCTFDEYPEDYVQKSRSMVYNSETIINIPTLFEGDKLYYFSTAGVVDYFVVERFEDLGWSIGLRNLKATESQKHVYMDLEDDTNGDCIMSPEFTDLYNLTKQQLMLDKIGGVRITPDFVENGIVVGLSKGSNYDVEIYNGTNYFYYNTDCNIRYFQAMELYALDEYLPLQDYLYEVEIPDYLLQGYYNFNGAGLVRYVKGSSYDEFTDFNEVLLYQDVYHTEMDGDSLKGTAAPYIYSENLLLNKFRAYDETCFGWVDEVLSEEEKLAQESLKRDKLASFKEASATNIDLWLPKDKECFVAIYTPETTGSISLKTKNGGKKMIVYNRLTGAYELSVKGKDTIATLEIMGLYSNYKISLTNAESYNGQDLVQDLGQKEEQEKTSESSETTEKED